MVDCNFRTLKIFDSFFLVSINKSINKNLVEELFICVGLWLVKERLIN